VAAQNKKSVHLVLSVTIAGLLILFSESIFIIIINLFVWIIINIIIITPNSAMITRAIRSQLSVGGWGY
jgi:hypothetical protein